MFIIVFYYIPKLISIVQQSLYQQLSYLVILILYYKVIGPILQVIIVINIRRRLTITLRLISYIIRVIISIRLRSSRRRLRLLRTNLSLRAFLIGITLIRARVSLRVSLSRDKIEGSQIPYNKNNNQSKIYTIIILLVVANKFTIYLDSAYTNISSNQISIIIYQNI